MIIYLNSGPRLLYSITDKDGEMRWPILIYFESELVFVLCKSFCNLFLHYQFRQGIKLAQKVKYLINPTV